LVKKYTILLLYQYFPHSIDASRLRRFRCLLRGACALENIMNAFGKTLLAIAAAVSFGAAANAAGPNLVVNGDFEGGFTAGTQTSVGAVNTNLYYNSNAEGWTHTPASSGGQVGWISTPGTTQTTGFSILYQGNYYLWGPQFGVNNGLVDVSPTGGNFLVSDADPYFAGTHSQVINGLTAGGTYRVSFYWAAAQLRNADGSDWRGDTTESWKVSFGNQSQSTALISNPDQGFQPWRKETFTFTAGSSSQALSFLAVGGPGGLPPIALLDGISLNAVPEPATWAMFIVGFGLVGAAARRKAAIAA
jgi:hypothetical protein